MSAPILVFAYNRPKHLEITIESLQKDPLSQNSELYLFSDGPKKVQDLPKIQEIRAYLDKLEGFKNIYRSYQDQNQGLARSIIQGVSQVLEKHERAIVIEDDLLCSADLLGYLNEGLDSYANRKDIFSISGFRFPFQIPKSYSSQVYLLPRPSSYGWATWQRAWEKVNWDVPSFPNFIRDRNLRRQFNRGGIDLSPMLINYRLGYIDSWAIRWAYAHYLHQAYCVCPGEGKVKHIGVDGSGTHYTLPRLKSWARKQSPPTHPWDFPKDLAPNLELIQNFSRAFRQSPIRKLINAWRRYKAYSRFPREAPQSREPL